MATIQFRSDPDLDERLDRLVDQVRASGDELASRSTVARMLLREVLDGSTNNVYQETVKRAHAVLQRVVNRILAEALENLDDIVAEELE